MLFMTSWCIYGTWENLSSLIVLDNEQEQVVREIIEPTYQYWGGGCITKTENDASRTLHLEVETRAATISVETLGKKLAKALNVDKVIINNAVYTA
mgnify:FL=1